MYQPRRRYLRSRVMLPSALDRIACAGAHRDSPPHTFRLTILHLDMTDAPDGDANARYFIFRRALIASRLCVSNVFFRRTISAGTGRELVSHKDNLHSANFFCSFFCIDAHFDVSFRCYKYNIY